MVSIQAGFAAAQWRGNPTMTRAGDFGGENDFIARFGLHPAADDFFGDALVFFIRRYRVHFRGIVEIDTRIKSHIQDTKGFFFVCLAAKGHGAHADIGNNQ
jgi:hypothetical protein